MAARRPNQTPLTANRKQAFLRELARHGVAIRAARASSPGSVTGSLTTFKDERQRDESFSLAWDEAIENAHASLLEELIRRAKEGVDVPLQNAKGEVVGSKKQYSDRLLLAAVQARFPEFTPRQKVEQETTVRARVESLGLDSLSPESQEQLLAILERETGHDAPPNGKRPTAALPIQERRR